MDFLAGLLCGAIVILILSRFRLLPLTARSARKRGRTVLRVRVVEDSVGISFYCNGPGGGYMLGHALYAAACLSADVIQNGDEGTERGLEIINHETLEILRRGGVNQ